MKANRMRYLLYALGTVFMMKIVSSMFLYNRLVDEEHFLHISHGQLDVELQRRAEVYKRTTSAVNTYVETEKKLFNLLIGLNGAIRTGADLNTAAKMQDEVSVLLSKLRALAEAAPALKAKGPYLYFMETIMKAEQNVVLARLHYNDAVAEYNTFLRLFPYNIVARLYDFKRAQFNGVEKGAEIVPEVARLDFTKIFDKVSR
ncbi:MAG: LemA family protein [Nitrospirota bacterium]